MEIFAVSFSTFELWISMTHSLLCMFFWIPHPNKIYVWVIFPGTRKTDEWKGCNNLGGTMEQFCYNNNNCYNNLSITSRHHELRQPFTTCYLPLLLPPAPIWNSLERVPAVHFDTTLQNSENTTYWLCNGTIIIIQSMVTIIWSYDHDLIDTAFCPPGHFLQNFAKDHFIS